MDLYGCVLWDLTNNSVNSVYNVERLHAEVVGPALYKTYSKFLHRDVNIIPYRVSSAQKFLKFFVSVLESDNQIITSAFCGGYVIIGIHPSVCSSVCLSVNSIIQKLIDGFSSNFHPLSTYALGRAD